MSSPEDRTFRRRPRADETPSVVPPELDAAAAEAGAPAEPPAAPAVAPARTAPASRRPTVDLEELAAASSLDRSEIDALMADFAPRTQGPSWRPGQRVTARVSRVTASTIFLDIGGKADAAMDRAEVSEDVVVGQQLDAYVGSVKDGELRLTRTISGDSSREMLEEAQAAGIPVQGKVTGANEHGFTVLLTGGLRGFCPLGQIDHVIDPDHESYVGRSLAFRILDVKGREAIVSHRSIAEEEAKAEQGRRLTEVEEGSVYVGTVVALREFGAFVRLPNGVEGLVHLSNIGKARLNHPNQALTEGQEVTVKVLGIDTERSRLSLGIRQALPGEAMSETRVDRAQLSSGAAGFGTFAGLLGGVSVAPAKAAKKAAAPAPTGTRRPPKR